MTALLSFAAPWALAAFLALPVLWWLLRLTPPPPRKLRFPGAVLLRDVVQDEQTPATTPWWLLALRLLIATLVILGAAQPLYKPPAALPGKGPVLAVIDNGWAAAYGWAARQDAARRLFAQAAREGRDVILLPTAPDAETGAVRLTGPQPAQALAHLLETMRPQPWRTEHAAVLALLRERGLSAQTYAAWFSDGLRAPETDALYAYLHDAGPVDVFAGEESIFVLHAPQIAGDALTVTVSRTPASGAADITVAAQGADGAVIARQSASFTSGASHVGVTLALPREIRNRVTALTLERRRGAAATLLLDEQWRRHLIGLSGDESALKERPLLSDLYYPARAIEPFAATVTGDWRDLLEKDISILIVTHNLPYNEHTEDLRRWIKAGGVLVRFAGPNLQDEMSHEEKPGDALLPVRLRAGDRALGGSLSWANPQTLDAFPPASPFRGLEIPPDVTVSRQVLAEPTADLPERTWAQLADGTPLVTAHKTGRGMIVLFHVPARAGWSTLPLSGLFVQMLERITGLAAGTEDPLLLGTLPPLSVLDGFGRLQTPPPPVTLPLTAETLAQTVPNAHQPPGFYGTAAARHAFNLGETIGDLQPFGAAPLKPLAEGARGIDFRPSLLMAACLLLLADWLAGLWLRGFIRRRMPRGAAAALVAALCFAAPHARADDTDAARITTLAYVKTGDYVSDTTTAAGLRALTEILKQRTAIDEISVSGVDLARDELAFYPLIYWTASPASPPLQPTAADNVNAYLAHGGMILIDTRDGGGANLDAPVPLERILRGVDVPALMPLPREHVLLRAFYLLDGAPGRTEGGPLWLEPESSARHDGVAGLLVGGNDWAAAWARDGNGKPLHAVMPGGERQREMAYRFGVNLVMYALTGNYKADQVHVPAILERLGP
ncbi:MAG: DUF4159 domain-containing protein [Alphaproteobacteria bacterium]|nr:DUF4159 domain-containing protein [Alphaproteobacteria bacterium]